MESKTYNLKELCRMAGVTERTVRYYISEELLAPPVGSGAFSRYNEEHLSRLQLIKQLKAEFLPLSQIKLLLKDRSPAQLYDLARQFREDNEQESGRPNRESSNGLAARLRPEQVNSLRESLARKDYPSEPQSPRRPYGLSISPAARSGPEMKAYPASGAPTRLVYQPPRYQPDLDFSPEPDLEPDEETAPVGESLGERWERVELEAGVELHFRQPIEADRQARLKKLIETARRMLEE